MRQSFSFSLSALDTDRFPRFSPPGCDSYYRWWPGTSFKSRLGYENVLSDKVRGALKVRKLFWCVSRFDDLPFLCTCVRRRRMPTGLAQTGGNRCSKITPIFIGPYFLKLILFRVIDALFGSFLCLIRPITGLVANGVSSRDRNSLQDMVEICVNPVNCQEYEWV